MEERKSIIKGNAPPAAPHVPEPLAEPEETAEVEKEKGPQIEIKQVPMDGVCGGY